MMTSTDWVRAVMVRDPKQLPPSTRHWVPTTFETVARWFSVQQLKPGSTGILRNLRGRSLAVSVHTVKTGCTWTTLVTWKWHKTPWNYCKGLVPHSMGAQDSDGNSSIFESKDKSR
jgi:hypothetical protein